MSIKQPLNLVVLDPIDPRSNMFITCAVNYNFKF